MARALERREALKVRLKQTVIVSPTKRHVDSSQETENVNPLLQAGDVGLYCLTESMDFMT